jgi:hypothetical protein
MKISFLRTTILANPQRSQMVTAGGVRADGVLEEPLGTRGVRADGVLEEPLGTPSTHLLLAEHHDRYRLLLKTFLTWKWRAQTQHERRKVRHRLSWGIIHVP